MYFLCRPSWVARGWDSRLLRVERDPGRALTGRVGNYGVKRVSWAQEVKKPG